METIEERAAAFADSKISGKVGKQCTAIGYIHGAQEQDRIARAEERERCINVVRGVTCELCLRYDAEMCKVTHCLTKDIIIAIEEGGDNGNE